jgi:hypothetical protein
MTSSRDFGFKRLSLDNWLTLDDAWRNVFMSYSSAVQHEGFIQDLIVMDLHDTVPLQVRKLYETARGALVYSVTFYPLLTLGSEQMLRVIDSATSHKCEQMKAPEIGKFFQRIEWLRKHKAIPASEESRWKVAVELRNRASHPTDQMIFNLPMALDVLDLTVELVNSLFITTHGDNVID